MFETFFFLSLAWLMFFGGEVLQIAKSRILAHQLHYAA